MFIYSSFIVLLISLLSSSLNIQTKAFSPSSQLVVNVHTRSRTTTNQQESWTKLSNSDHNDDAFSSITTSSTSLFSSSNNKTEIQRSTFMTSLLSTTLLTFVPNRPSHAKTTTTTTLEPKLRNLSNNEIIDIIQKDISQNQFLATAKLTRSIYSESSIFTDEIDTYPIQKWITGTQALFIGSGSNVKLVGDVVYNEEKNEISFQFEEDLMFNLKIARPVVHLTGKVVLVRDMEDGGLIKSYREYWDQDVNTVLKSAKF